MLVIGNDSSSSGSLAAINNRAFTTEFGVLPKA